MQMKFPLVYYSRKNDKTDVPQSFQPKIKTVAVEVRELDDLELPTAMTATITLTRTMSADLKFKYLPDNQCFYVGHRDIDAGARNDLTLAELENGCSPKKFPMHPARVFYRDFTDLGRDKRVLELLDKWCERPDSAEFDEIDEDDELAASESNKVYGTHFVNAAVLVGDVVYSRCHEPKYQINVTSRIGLHNEEVLHCARHLTYASDGLSWKDGAKNPKEQIFLNASKDEIEIGEYLFDIAWGGQVSSHVKDPVVHMPEAFKFNEDIAFVLRGADFFTRDILTYNVNALTPKILSEVGEIREQLAHVYNDQSALNAQRVAAQVLSLAQKLGKAELMSGIFRSEHRQLTSDGAASFLEELAERYERIQTAAVEDRKTATLGIGS